MPCKLRNTVSVNLHILSPPLPTLCVCVLPFCFSQLTALLANTVHCSEQGICSLHLARSLRSIADGGPKQLRASIPCRQKVRTHCGLFLRPSARPLAALASR